MKNQNVIIGVIAIVAILGGIMLFSQNDTDSETSMMAKKENVNNSDDAMDNQDNNVENNTIVDIAINNEDFSTLVTAVTEAGLVDTLSSEGPFTVFAPTNAAFEKLPAGTLEAVLQDKEQLTSILTYHVVSGKVMSTDLTDGMTATTVQGDDITIGAHSGVTVNDANVVTADIEASNGVIHVIDTVLLPQ